MPYPVRVRRAGESDLGALVPLFDAYRRFYDQASDVAGARRFLRARFRARDSVVFLATRGGTPVGFTQLYPSFSSVSMRRLWILNDLYVDPVARGLGVGRRLLDAAKTHATKTRAKGLVLETARDNPAQRLYERAGYERDETFFHYFLATPSSV